jgi:tRNA(Ile)-lysidine synthase
MIKLLMPLPKKIYVACSGGVDSMAALDFLNRKHDVTAAFFDHRTETSGKALYFLARVLKERGIKLEVSVMGNDCPKGASLEEHWRNERYKFLDSLDATVVTAHHLDDAVETWVWSCMNGNPKLPQIQRGNVLRPFLATPKMELIDWCTKNNVFWLDDLSNFDTRFTRNMIRHEVMPVIQKINPGIQKTIKKKLIHHACKV